MASEEATEPLSISVPPELSAWLESQADERGVDPETYARELLLAQRAVDADAFHVDGVDSDAGPLDGVAREAEVEDRLDDVREEFRELLEDVRSRVVQVKRETDRKAAADHDHAELLADIETLTEQVAALEADLAEQRTAVEELRADLEGGFDNFEEVLEHVLAETDELFERADRLGHATVRTRERVQELATSVVDRERADDLKRDAALEGVETADCEDCDRAVRLALLTEPRCPACRTEFVDLEPKRGFFGSATLVTGDHPALTDAELEAVTDDIEADVETDRPHPADVDWDRTGEDT